MSFRLSHQTLHQKLKNQESANVAEPLNCVVPSVQSMNNSSLALPTFDDIVKRSERKMKSSRVNHGHLFGFQIPPWIKEERVVSSGTTTTLSFGHAREYNCVRAALVVDDIVPNQITADCATSKASNGEKTDDLVFFHFEIRGTIHDKKKKDEDEHEQGKHQVAVFLRRYHATTQEKSAGTIKGHMSGPNSNMVYVEMLLSPTKVEASYCVAVVGLYKKTAHTLLNIYDKKIPFRNTNYGTILPISYQTLSEYIYLRLVQKIKAHLFSFFTYIFFMSPLVCFCYCARSIIYYIIIFCI